MNEYPILFSEPMVRAILEGRKNQTRRIIKPQPLGNIRPYWDISKYNGDFVKPEHCPYGQPGDRLWVRETWATYWRHNTDGYVYPLIFTGPIDLTKFTSENLGYPFAIGKAGGIEYRASYPKNGYSYNEPGPYVGEITKWRPSIHMPRWASRINLIIEKIWIERLQDISDLEAKMEGFEPDIPGSIIGCKRKFIDFMNSIYAKQGYGWDSNPWVLVRQFHREPLYLNISQYGLFGCG